MARRPRVAVIVPAYNEENRIAAVLEVVGQSSLVDEVLVVDDGSTDDTRREASGFGAKIVGSSSNRGKGAALQQGVAETTADVLVFIDADLVGLTQQHLTELVTPLLEDEDLEMTIGRFQGGRRRTDWAQTLVPSISGQRAVRRSFFVDLPDLAQTRFAAEVVMTKHAKENNKKVEEVLLADLTHIMKEEKLGFLRGFWARLGMYSDMLRHKFSPNNRQPGPP